MENQTTETQIEKTEETPVEVTTPSFDPFAEQPELEQPSNIVNEIEETVADAPRETNNAEATKTDEEEIVDADKYLQENLGFTSWDDAKAAVAELKALKETAQTPAEIKYANEQSKLAAEYLLNGETDKLYDILDKQRKLAAVDKMDAESAIKLKIQQDNPLFKSDDIQDVFEEKYSLDDKPLQGVDELEEEFTARMNKWQVKAEKVNRRIERDAITAKAELSKLRSELVLPDIFKKEQPAKAQEPTPEELAKNKAYVDSFLKSAETSVKGFQGFTATVKDKDVEIPISYQPTDEQKAKITGDLKMLAENNFDANILLAPRWVNKDGSLNTDQITKDYFRLLYGEQAEQKFANEGASKRLVEKSKKDSNVTIKSNSTQNRTLAVTNTSQSNNLAEFFFQNS